MKNYVILKNNHKLINEESIINGINLKTEKYDIWLILWMNLYIILRKLKTKRVKDIFFKYNSMTKFSWNDFQFLDLIDFKKHDDNPGKTALEFIPPSLLVSSIFGKH